MSLVAAAVALAGCVQDPRSAPTTTRDLTTYGPADAPTLPMTEVPLATHADFDALEDKLLVRMRPDTLIAIYESLAETARPAEEPADALLLLRLAMLHLKSGTDAERLQSAFAVADRLRVAAPDSPHTHFVHAHVTSLLMQVEDDGAFTVAPARRDIAVRQIEHWEKLLEVAPDYVGPEGWSAAEVREALGSLKAALASAEEEAPAGGAPPPDGAAVSDVAARAASDLERFDAGDRVARRTLCRDREEARDDRMTPTTDAWRWLNLRCGVELGRHDRALSSVAALVRSGASVDACRWLRTIPGGAEAARADVGTARSKRGLPPCP